MARGRSTRMAKVWQGAFNTANISLGTTQVNVLQSVESDLNQTLLRVRGNILVSATPNAATDIGIVAFGLVVVSSQAANAGGVSLPGPIADIEADWLWHTFVSMDAIILTVADANARLVVHRVEIDAKAMRKIPGDSVVVLVGETTAIGFPDVDALAGMRFLLAH